MCRTAQFVYLLLVLGHIAPLAGRGLSDLLEREK